jgi:hypothetical protein
MNKMNTIKISTIKVLFIFLALSMLNNTGFATNGTIATYWSSSQKGSMNFSTFSNFTNGVANAYQQFFFGGSAGTQTDLGISNPRRVRAIRIF